MTNSSSTEAGLSRPARSSPKIANQIIESLRQDIVSGRLPKGSRLPTERDLAERYAVSQPTIREALRVLDAMGLIEVRHGSGAFVGGNGAYAVAFALQTLLQVASVGIMEVLDVREILGRETARAAAGAATSEEVEHIQQALLKLRQLDDVVNVDEIIDRITAFQHAISAAAHNPLLLALETFLMSLLLQVQVKALQKRGVRYWRQRSLAFHSDRERISDAIAAGLPDEAHQAMEAYLNHQRQTFERDPELQAMRLSDPRVISAVATMVERVRNMDSSSPAPIAIL